MKSKICYNTGLELKEIFEIDSAYIWKLKYIIYSEDLDSDIDCITNSDEIFEQIIDFLETISNTKINSYEQLQKLIQHIEEYKNISIEKYFESCINTLDDLNKQYQFKNPLSLKDLINNQWKEKIRK